MDDKTLDEIRARAETATPNKWAVADYREDIASLISEVRPLKLAMKQVKDGHDRYVCPFCDANLSCVCGKGGTLPHKDNCPMFTPEGEFK